MKNSITILLFALLFASSCEKDKPPTDTGKDEPHGLGCIFADSTTLAAIPIVDTGYLFNGRLAALPIDFALVMPPIKSQGSEGSCVAFAVGYATRSYQLHRDQNISYFKINTTNTLEEKVIFSPEYLYNNIKSTGNCDVGTNIPKALNFLKTNGISTWNAMPYSSTNGCTTLPNAAQNSNAANFKIDDYYRVVNYNTAYLKEIIYNGNPIIIAVAVDDGFWRSGNFIWNSRHGVDIGGHAMAICGWDDTKNAFKVMNSWGTSWGFNGFGWIDYNYLVSLLNAHNNEAYVMKTKMNYNLVPKLSVDTVRNITSTSATLGGTITSLGTLNEPIIERGIEYDSLNLPIIFIRKKVKSTATTNTFTVNVNTFTPNTRYYFWPFASNVYGTGRYSSGSIFTGGGKSFYTLANSIPVVPTLTTTAFSSLTNSTASTGGNITNDGGATITARGVCYATTANPTIVDNKTTNGTGSGIFTSSLSALTMGTVYYARAYATNSAGTAYGNQITFITNLIDIDNNQYKVTQIGTQLWMAENLKTSRDKLGNAIPYTASDTIWGTTHNPYYFYYDYNAANNATYGKLYNGYAATSGNLCPNGWHVPTATEYTTLSTYLGGNAVAGGKLKATTLWQSPNTGATNSSGFNALPAGQVDDSWGFHLIPRSLLLGQAALFWTSTNDLQYMKLDVNSASLSIQISGKNYGYSCRCIKN
jgi:uncharacterized protein (TIGR02145 family)